MLKRFRAFQLGYGFWTLTDQCAVSLGNFLTQIVLARNLPPAEYVIFALLFGVMIVLNTCNSGLITYPLTLKGAEATREGLPKLVTSSTLLTAALAVPLSGVLIAATLVLRRMQVAVWVVLALLFWQLQETVRRGLMAHLRHREALFGDGLSYLGQAGLIWALAQRGDLTVSAAFAVIASTSAIAWATQVLQVGLKAARWSEIVSMVPFFWRMGNQALLTNATDATTVQSFPWMLVFFCGPQEAASFQAVSNVLGVTNPVVFSAGNLIVPAAAKAHHNFGVKAASRSACRYGLQGASLLLPYYALLLIGPRFVLSMFYGQNSSYVALGTALRLFVLAYLVSYSFFVLASLFNALGRPSLVFLAELGGAGAALAVGLPLAARYGILGACVGLVLVVSARLFVASFFAWNLPSPKAAEQASSEQVPVIQQVRATGETDPSTEEIRALFTKPF